MQNTPIMDIVIASVLVAIITGIVSAIMLLFIYKLVYKIFFSGKRELSFLKGVAIIMLCSYIAAVAYITIFGRGLMDSSGNNFIPFFSYLEAIFSQNSVSGFYLFANIIMLIPLGMILPFLSKRLYISLRYPEWNSIYNNNRVCTVYYI